MNIKLLLPSICMLLFTSAHLYAQDTDNAKHVSDKIATRLNDSLHLDISVRKQVYDINMLLNRQKMQVWKTVTDSVSLQNSLQSIENTRDSLYKSVLSADKYRLYIDRKALLINGN